MLLLALHLRSGSLRFATWSSWHTPQPFVVSMSSLIRGQYTDSRANIRVFSTPWCPLCNWFRMVPRILSGIITCFTLNRTPSSIPSSSLNDQNERRSFGRSVILSRHPWYTTSDNAFRIGQRRVSSRNSCCLVGLNCTRSSDSSSTVKSSCTSDLSDGLGRRDNTYDMIISLPGRYLTL